MLFYFRNPRYDCTHKMKMMLQLILYNHLKQNKLHEKNTWVFNSIDIVICLW